MAFGDSDLSTFFKEFAVPVISVSRAINTLGVIDSATESHDFNSQRSEVMVGVISILVQTSTISALKKNDPLTVDGISYLVSQIDREADGKTSRVHLRYA